jgi:hypothetical protein
MILSGLLRMNFKGISCNRKGYTYMKLLGMDTETCVGKPMTFQWHDGNKSGIEWVNGKNVTEKFLFFLDDLPYDNSMSYIIFMLNMLFDFCILFYPYLLSIVEQEKDKGEFELKIFDWKISGFVSNNNHFVRLKKGNEQHGKLFEIVDVGDFFEGSLAKLTQKLLGSDQKIPHPKGLGKRIFGKKDKAFIHYAVNDAIQTYRMGKKINDFHGEYDVRQTISLPQLGEKIFRHKFLEREIPPCPYQVLFPSLKSYHGGKNGMYVNPGWYDVYYYDLISAYPWVMFNLPDFSEGEFYEVQSYEPDYPGIYNLTQPIKTCKYPVFFSDDFKPLKGIDTMNKKIWVTGEELSSAVKWGEYPRGVIKGFIFVSHSKEIPALRNYIAHFMDLKNKHKNNKNLSDHTVEGYYEFYKKLMNALYGKFIQMREKQGPLQKEIVTGKMFHPFIASQITGKVRARMHDLEHQFKAIHTATDSIMTLKPIPEKYLGKDLGDLKFECKGKVLLLRNKLYLFYENGKLTRYALHGFRGKAEQLRKAWDSKKFSYSYDHMMKPKEAIIQKRDPFRFYRLHANLNLTP